jgi:Family of unknown function (DUF6263)
MTRRIVTAATALVAVVASVAPAQVKLEHTFREGSDARYQAVSKTHQILVIDGKKEETRTQEVPTFRWTVGARTPDGTRPVRQTLEAIRTRMDLPGGVSLSFDSSDPAAKPEDPQLAVFADIYRAIVGAEITFLVDDEHRVKAVEGTETILSKATELNPKAGELLKGSLDPEKLKSAFTQHVVSFPTTLLREGDTWDRTERLDIAGGQSLMFLKRYEYRGTVEREGVTLDRIGVQAQGVTYVVDPAAPPPRVSKSALKIASSDGTILFDRKRGMPVEIHHVTRITGDLTLETAEKQLPATLDLTLDIAAELQK